MPTPHDGVFKTFLTHPAIARDFLTFHLPPALLKVCNLDTLTLESGSFLEEDLRPYFADVLYSLKTVRGDLLDSLVTLILAGYTTEQPLAALITWMLQNGDSAQPQALLASLAHR